MRDPASEVDVRAVHRKRSAALILALAAFESRARDDEGYDPSELPLSVQHLIDALLEDWDGATPLQDGLGLIALCEWITCHYEALGLGEWGEDTPCPIDPWDLADRFSDDGSGGLLESVPWPSDSEEPKLTDEMRVAHIRSVLEEREPMGGAAYCCGSFPLVGKHHEGTLAFAVRGSSFEGLSVSWFGVFSSSQSAWDYLRSCGWVFSEEAIDAAPDDELLKLWRNKKKVKRNRYFGAASPRSVQTTLPAFAPARAYRSLLVRALEARLQGVSEHEQGAHEPDHTARPDLETPVIREILTGLGEPQDRRG